MEESLSFLKLHGDARCAWTGLGQEPGHGASIVDWSAGSTRTLAMGPARSVVSIPAVCVQIGWLHFFLHPLEDFLELFVE